MSLREHGLRPRDVVTVGITAAALAYVVLSWWFRRGATLPPVTWLVAPVLLVAAGGLVVAGRSVRATIRGTATRPVEVLAAYRILRLAQACALTGALVTGVYLAYAGVALPDVDAASVRSAVLSAVGVAGSGVLLAGAGLWVQAMCRIDRPRADDQEPGAPDSDDR